MAYKSKIIDDENFTELMAIKPNKKLINEKKKQNPPR